MASRLFPDGQNSLFSPLIDVVANGMAAMFVILMVYMALFNTEPTPPIAFLDVDPPPAVCGIPYTFTPALSGGSVKREFLLTSGEGMLTHGLRLDKDTGTIFGTPDCAGRPGKVETVAAGLTGRSNSVPLPSVSFAIHPGAVPYGANRKLAIQTTDPTLPAARVGVPYALPLGAEGGAQPFYRWSLAKGRPPGLSLGQTDGVLRGTPTQPGLFEFDVKIEHGSGQFSHRGTSVAWVGAQQTRSYRLEVLGESKPRVELPVARIGEPYLGVALLAGRAPGEALEVLVGDKGLTVGTDGLITGRPLQAGTQVVTYKVTRGAKPVHEGKANLTVLPARHKVEVRDATYHAFEGEAFRIPIAVSGLQEPIDVAIASLPTWAKLDDRAITGKAPAPGTYQLKPSASDLLGVKATGALRLEVTARLAPLAIETPSLIELPTGTTRYPLSATGGDGNYRWSVAGDIPRGVSLSPSGLLESNVPKPGDATLKVKVQDRSGGTQTRETTLRFKHVQTKSLTLLSTELATGVVGVPYRLYLAVDGSVGQTKFVAKGTLPKGIDVKDGIIIGTPRQAGSWPLQVEVIDEKGQHLGPQQLTLNVVPGDQSLPRVTTDELPRATVGSVYKVVLAAEGGQGKYLWEIRGSMPPGLRRTENGIAGTPDANAAGRWSFQASVRDEAGRTTPEQNLVLVIDESWPALEIQTKALSQGIVRSRYVAPLIARGCWGQCTWNAQGLPPGVSLANGVLDGIPERSGSYDVRIIVSDEKKRRTSRLVVLNVSAG